jgi:hypothetical protein
MRLNNLGLPIRRFRKRAGRAYELAYAYIQDSDDASDWVLVHGEKTSHGNLVMDHAWLRRGRTVYDPVDDQYSSVDERFRYTVAEYTQKEAMRMGVAQGHYGPWHWGIFLPTGGRSMASVG